MSVEREAPWPMPEKSFCQFYHSMDFPDGDQVVGSWDIRGRFNNYIGGYSLKGKTVLDVGTSSGFLAFEAELAGAKVTSTDLKHISELTLLPYKEHPYQYGDLLGWEADVEEGWKKIKSAFWYAWHKNNSEVSMVYSPLRDLRYWDERFDVVVAGALLEHLGDPVTAVGVFARLAREAIIVAFTPVINTDDLLMRPVTNLKNARDYFTWWALSRGLYHRIFDNLGFDIEIVQSSAFDVQSKVEQKRSTLIARRR
jgi:SAM-dependent methyltransferase